jgi:hypothetical protein
VTLILSPSTRLRIDYAKDLYGKSFKFGFSILKFRFTLALWERARVRALPIVHGTLTSMPRGEEE